ncbi:MAG: DUF2004 domain-containing protein [Sandaracinaceae bacterium]
MTPRTEIVSRAFGVISGHTLEAHRGTVTLDFTVDDADALTVERVADIDAMVDALDAYRDEALRQLEESLHAEEPKHEQVTPFWEFHRDEMDGSVTRERFVSTLCLRRAGFYPGREPFMVLDFEVSGPVTDPLLVANFDRHGVLLYVSWES